MGLWKGPLFFLYFCSNINFLSYYNSFLQNYSLKLVWWPTHRWLRTFCRNAALAPKFISNTDSRPSCSPWSHCAGLASQIMLQTKMPAIPRSKRSRKGWSTISQGSCSKGLFSPAALARFHMVVPDGFQTFSRSATTLFDLRNLARTSTGPFKMTA